MTHSELTMLIIGMALSMLVIRVTPVTLFAQRELPNIVQKWFKYIPPALLAALVTSEIFTSGGEVHFSFSNLHWIVAIPTCLVAIKTKSLFATIIFGMAFMAFLRLGLAYV